MTADKTTEKKKPSCPTYPYFFLQQLVQIHLLALQQGTNTSREETAFIISPIHVKKNREVLMVQIPHYTKQTDKEANKKPTHLT